MNIYWDRINRVMVASLLSPARVSAFAMTARDTDSLRVYVLTPQSGNPEAPFVQGELDAGESLALSIKVKTVAGLAAATSLVDHTAFALVGTGATAYYTATLNLNTAELVAEIATWTALSGVLQGELVAVQSDGTQRDSTPFDAQIRIDVLRQDNAPTSVGSTALFRDYVNADGIYGVAHYNKTGVLMSIEMPLGVNP
jgi:hypothetical protein